MSAGRFLMKRHFPVAACGCLFANGKQDGLVEWGVHDRNGPVRVDLSIDAATPSFYPLLSTYVRQLIYRRAYIPIHVPVDRYTKKRANKQSHFEKTKQKNCGIRRRFRFPPSVSTQYRLLKYKRTVKFRCWQKYFIIVWQNNISKHQRQSISSTDFVSMLHWENKGHDPPILSFWVVAQSVGGCREPQQKHQPSTMI